MPSANGHGPKPERIALYLRVSSEEQVERESIGTQEEFLADYCKLYGLDVAGIYKDEAVSGTWRQEPNRRRKGRQVCVGYRVQAGPDRTHAARGRGCA